MYNFKRFTDVKKSFNPKVTIRSGGHLGISQAAAERFGIDREGYYGIFFYDNEARVIGVRLTLDKDEAGAVKIQYRTGKTGDTLVVQASIKAFLDCYQIDYSRTVSFRPEQDEQGGMIIIDLKKPLETKTRKRQKGLPDPEFIPKQAPSPVVAIPPAQPKPSPDPQTPRLQGNEPF